MYSGDGVKRIAQGAKTALVVGGLFALALGVTILVWPGKTAMAMSVLVGIYAVLMGIVYLGVALSASGKSGWNRLGNSILGLLFIVGGVILFFNLGAATVALWVVFGVFIGIVWIIEGVMALTTLGGGGNGWAVFYGIISIIAGITLLFSPMLGAAILWILLGAFLSVMGVVQLVRGFSLKVG